MSGDEPPDPIGDEPPDPIGDDHAEARRLRRTGRHLLLSVVAVGLFGLAFLAVYWWTPRGEPPPDPSPGPSPSPSPTVTADNLTVLIQATTRDGAMGGMLTAVQPGAGGGSKAVLLSLPHDLVVAAPGAEQQLLFETVASLDTLRPTAAVAATLGVHVDASWRLDRKALAGLVDSVNGVTVDVTERTRIRDENGQVVVTLRPGRQRLSGTTASWYAVGAVATQTDLQQAQRFADVLTRTLARLPESDLAIRESLTALGTLAPSTIATQDLATYLDELATTIRSGALTAATVPTTAVTIGPTVLRWTNFDEATGLLRRALPDSLWRVDVDGSPRVLVLAPPGQPGWIGYVRTQLAGAGFVFVDGRGTPPSARRTTIMVRGERAWARDLDRLLAIPADASTVVPAPPPGEPPRGRPWADADVNLGLGYLPGVGDPRVSARPTTSSSSGRSGVR